MLAYCVRYLKKVAFVTSVTTSLKSAVNLAEPTLKTFFAGRIGLHLCVTYNETLLIVRRSSRILHLYPEIDRNKCTASIYSRSKMGFKSFEEVIGKLPWYDKPNDRFNVGEEGVIPFRNVPNSLGLHYLAVPSR